MKLKVEMKVTANGEKKVKAANPPAAFCVFAQQKKVFYAEGRYPDANRRAPMKRRSQ